MKARIISAAVMLTGVFLCMLTPITRILLIFVAGILGTYEVHRVCKKLDRAFPVNVIYFYLFFNALFCAMGMLTPFMMLSLYVCAVLLMQIVCICKKDYAANGAMSGVFALGYPSVLFIFLMMAMSDEKWYVICALAAFATWLCDAFAMFGGMLYGKHKMCPTVSPKKTWEGTLTGAAFSLLGGVAVKLIWSDDAPALWVCLLVCLISSSLGQFGDLAASLLKRYADVKDYSKLIPGHGGVMDRVDSLLFSIPTALMLLSLARHFGIW